MISRGSQAQKGESRREILQIHSSDWELVQKEIGAVGQGLPLVIPSMKYIAPLSIPLLGQIGRG